MSNIHSKAVSKDFPGVAIFGEVFSKGRRHVKEFMSQIVIPAYTLWGTRIDNYFGKFAYLRT